MPSPFPGMNPYLEQESVWQDFHQTFIPLLREALNPQVRPKYFVKVEEYVFLHELPAEERIRLGRPDWVISETGSAASRPLEGIKTAAPAYTYLPAVAVDRESHGYLTVRDRDSKEVVTVIELLSPSNKNPGADRVDYLRKRREFFSLGIHVVEIDLLRGGPRLPFSDVPRCDYLISVSRAEERPGVPLWPVNLREPLPRIPIPLRAPDADAEVDLQQALHRTYDSAGYAEIIYKGTPQPPLSAEDAAWARQFLPL